VPTNIMKGLDRPVFSMNQNDRESGNIDSKVISSLGETGAMHCEDP
jgi:hypothetical protein